MGGGTGVVLPAESSQTAIDRLNELALLAPVIESPTAKPVEIPKSAASHAPERIERFYSDGSRMERWKVWVSSLPLSFTLGLGFYLYFTGAPEWVPGAVMLAGFVVFGLVGLLIEHQRLKAFVCPCCQAPIKDWDTNETHRILFNCARCASSWDIKYKERTYLVVDLRNRLRRSGFSTVFSCRGAR